jgi:homoserine acetyltransferase
MNDATLPRTGDSGPADIGIVEDRFFTIRDLALSNGAVLPEATIAYETYGRLAPHGRNAVLVTHGFTGSHHAAGRNPANGGQPGSWDGLIGPGKPIDTDRLFVVASNMLGSSYGSTNAASVNPATGKPYGPDSRQSRSPTSSPLRKTCCNRSASSIWSRSPGRPTAATRRSSGR